ncbi:hypothetical protein A1F99_092080 [Pyrenophora tritici-repentis]|nr:hypothetical protein A1F99_092080 [Pyrenophora tritici-repentis]
MSSNAYFEILELEKQIRDLRANSEQERTANNHFSDILASQPRGGLISTNSRPTRHQVIGSGNSGREIASSRSKDKVRKRNNEAKHNTLYRPGQRLGPTTSQSFTQNQVPVRSFPTKVNWGGLAAVAYLEVPLSSKIQLPKSSMTLWDLIGWLTDRIYGNNSRGATEEKAALQEISEWAAKIHGDLDADNKQRRIFLVSLIGKQVKLNSGAYLKLIGMSEDEFVVQDTEGAKYIVGKHVELEDAQPHASV